MYPQMFQRLQQAVIDCSPDLRAFVKQLSEAPVFDNDAARAVIADATERIDAYLEECGRENQYAVDRLHLAQMQEAALSELRGEVVGLPDTAARRQTLFNARVQKQIPLTLGVNDLPLFATRNAAL